MKQAISPLLQIGICAAGYLYATSNATLAQITSDGTVNTQVNQNGNVSEITGGETQGSNLFHSFQDFSVPTGNEAFFDNADSISNIFSRVTGDNISNIDGTIRANGSASLFLINPAGIIFGENARLDIGGSFYGSTASSILFPDNIEFSASNTQTPILTINAPIGLNLRDNPQPITNKSVVNDVGLQVNPGQNFTLIGGNINFEGGIALAPSGRIELGGLSRSGTVNLSESFSTSLPENATRADINLTDGASINVASGEGGSISLDARNINLTGGSQIVGGLIAEDNAPNANAGNITIDAADTVRIDGVNPTNDLPGFSIITNNVGTGAVGNAGGISVSTGNLILATGGNIISSTSGLGNAGSIDITATDTITFDTKGTNIPTTISNNIGTGAVGNAGGISVNTGSLTLANGAAFSTVSTASGSTGSIDITATDTITFDGQAPNGFASGIGSQVLLGAEGNTGNITVDTGNLTLTNGAILSTINAGSGNAGSIDIIAANNITVEGESLSATSSTISSQIASSEGDAGDINIATGSLFVTKGGRITAASSSQAIEISPEQTREIVILDGGNAGDINIIATDTITIDGERSNGISSNISSSASENSVGDAGSINIQTKSIALTNGGQVLTNTLSQGDGGDVEIKTTESITISGATQNNRSGLFANALINDGNGGNIRISAERFAIEDGGAIEVGNFDSLGDRQAGTGEPGNINIEVNSLSLSNEARIEAATQFTGGASGIINLNIAEDIILRNNSSISARAFREANGGNLDIDARFIIAFPNGNNDILASAKQGRGGNISINAESLFGIQERFPSNSTNDINASSEVSGLDGTVTITTPDINPIQGATELPTNVVEPEETNQQACEANREAAAKNGLNITGKGGILPEPGLPLNSLNVTVNGENNLTSSIPAPIETGQGKIQPARGVRVTESGEVILTAYRTNNAGDRIPEGSANCGGL